MDLGDERQERDAGLHRHVPIGDHQIKVALCEVRARFRCTAAGRDAVALLKKALQLAAKERIIVDDQDGPLVVEIAHFDLRLSQIDTRIAGKNCGEEQARAKPASSWLIKIVKRFSRLTS
jgi:hypothetical protein